MPQLLAVHFTGHMPLLLPSQHRQSTEGQKRISKKHINVHTPLAISLECYVRIIPINLQQ